MAKKILMSIMLVSILVVYLLFDPALYSFFPRCPFFVSTGLYCPGCGSQRALHKIFTGRIAEAAGLNLLAVLYLPLIVVYYISAFNTKNQFHQSIVRLINKKWFILATLAFILIFCIARNTNTYIGKQLAP